MNYAKGNNSRKIVETFTNIQNEVLDEYNKGTISGKEMGNILRWCEAMKEKMLKEIDG